jgi:hypothetical protein
VLCDELHTLVQSEQQATLVGKRQRPEIQHRINEQSVYTDIEVRNFDIEVKTSILVYTDIKFIASISAKTSISVYDIRGRSKKTLFGNFDIEVFSLIS